MPVLLQQRPELHIIHRLDQRTLYGRKFDELLLRTNGSLLQTAAAIGANIVEHIVHTVGTKSTFEGTDHGFGAVRRKRLSAILADGSELKHGGNWLIG